MHIQSVKRTDRIALFLQTKRVAALLSRSSFFFD